MSSTNSDFPGLRLDPESYEALHQQVPRRDGWRCQSCGTMSNVEVHHKQFRGHSGHNSEENLDHPLLRVSFLRPRTGRITHPHFSTY